MSDSSRRHFSGKSKHLFTCLSYSQEYQEYAAYQRIILWTLPRDYWASCNPHVTVNCCYFMWHWWHCQEQSKAYYEELQSSWNRLWNISAMEGCLTAVTARDFAFYTMGLFLRNMIYLDQRNRTTQKNSTHLIYLNVFIKNPSFCDSIEIHAAYEVRRTGSFI